MSIQPGQTILNGKYHILRLIGEGGMARVWLAEELTFSRRPVALKEPRDDLLPDLAQEVRLRYQREVQVCAALDKARVPNIVRAFTADPYEDTVLLALEYMPGGDLAALLKKHPEGLPVERAVRITLDLLKALEGVHAHELEIVHRDVKPSNVLFDEGGKAHLADFGLAQLAGVSGRSQLVGGQHPGTPRYMAPEQESSPRSLTPAADLYAVGCILFEMLTGKRYKRVRPGTLPSALRADVPGWLDEVMVKALAEDPWDRHQRAKETAHSLSEGLRREVEERARARAAEEARQRQAEERARLQAAKEARRREAEERAQAQAVEEARQREAEQRARAEAAEEKRRRKAAERAQREEAFSHWLRKLFGKDVPRAAEEKEVVRPPTAEVDPETQQFQTRQPKATVERAQLEASAHEQLDESAPFPTSVASFLRVLSRHATWPSWVQTLLSSEVATHPKADELPKRARWTIYAILICVVALPIITGEPLLLRTIEPPAAIVDMHGWIESLASGAPVLVAFDYDPTSSGEMDMIAKALIGHLMDKDARMVVVSLLPAGPATAQMLLADLAAGRPDYAEGYGERYANLGYLPGQAMGVRLLGQSVKTALPRDFYGTPLSDLPMMQGLNSTQDFSLLIELAAAQDTLRWWIEQAGAPYGIPVGTGSGAAVMPFARPYYETESRQLVGLVGGMQDAITYEALARGQTGPTSRSAARLDSQLAGQIVFILVVLAGNVIYFLQRRTRRER